MPVSEPMPIPTLQHDFTSVKTRKYNWNPAPEDPDQDEDVSSSPLEDIYGVLKPLGLDDDEDEPAVVGGVGSNIGIGMTQRQYQPQKLFTGDHWRAVIFLASQLTPPGYLNLPQWKMLRPANFRIVCKPSPQVTLKTAMFYIEPKLGANYGPEFFVVRVIGPSGIYLSVEVNRDRDKGCDGWMECIFRPMEPGPHNVHVFLGSRDAHNIDGSPMRLDIGRNYAFYGDTNLVLIDIDNPPMPSCLNELSFPPMGRLWAVTTGYSMDVLYATTATGKMLQFEFADRTLKLTAVLDLFKMTNSGKQVFRATAITYDPVSRLLVVTESTQHRVSKFTLEGNFVITFGTPGQRGGEFMFPSGVAVSPDGNLIAVSDSGNGRIQLFTSLGQFITQRHLPARQFRFQNNGNIVGGLMFNAQGDKIYFTDTLGQEVLMLNLDLTTQMVFDQKPYDITATPVGFALDNIGNILLCDKKSDVLRIFNPNGVLIHSIFGTGNNPIELPEQVLVLRNGYCCVLDKGGKRLRIF